MKFVEALKEMKAGNKVKLPSWGGYWRWDEEKQTIIMHTKEGAELDIRETDRVEYTFSNVASEDWELAHEGNTPILGGVAQFNFSEALKYIKRGLKVTRLNWNGKGQYVMLHDPYNNDEYTLVEKETSNGTMYPHIVIKTNYNAIVPWLASQTDMLAEDWVFAE